MGSVITGFAQKSYHMGLKGVNGVLRGFYGHYRGLQRVVGRRLCRPHRSKGSRDEKIVCSSFGLPDGQILYHQTTALYGQFAVNHGIATAVA